jgi:CBS domain-containing protein
MPPVHSFCRRKACLVLADETLQAAAERMEREGVGMLVVVAAGHPAGVLTDRDVALQLLAPVERVADAMSPKPFTVRADAPLADAMALMARHGVRRLPVVDATGHSQGVIATDDVVRLLASEIAGLAEVAEAQLPAELEPGAPASPRTRDGSADHYLRPVVTVPPGASLRSAVERMHEQVTGCVVVVGEAGGAEGILTDRDVALRAVAKGLDASRTLVSSVMTAPVVACDAGQRLDEVVERMRAQGVRRMPILRGGRVAGILTYDDLLAAFAGELAALARAARRQVQRERRRVRIERTRDEVGRGLAALRRGARALRSRLHASQPQGPP